MQIHPSDILLRELLEDPRCLSPKVRAHLGECGFCQRRIRNLLSTSRRSDPDYDYSPGQSLSFVTCWQQRLTWERVQAPKLLSILLEQSEARRELLIRNHPRFQTWGLLELILEQSHELTFNDPAGSEGMGNLALRVSIQLSPSIYGLERIEDMRARAWAYIGNSLRVRTKLEEADQALARSFAHLRRGTGDIIERATILRLKGVLRKDQHRLKDALPFLQRAVQVFREAGDEHQVGSSLVSISVLHHLQGEPDQATSLIKEALPMLDARREPRTVFSAHFNLIGNFLLAGRLMEAQKALTQNRSLYRKTPEPWVQSELHYAQGDLYRRFGLYREAKTHLQLALQAFLDANRPAIAAEVYQEILALPEG